MTPLEYKQRLRALYLLAALLLTGTIALLACAPVEGHDHQPVPLGSAQPASALRLSPDRHEPPAARASRTRRPSAAHHAVAVARPVRAVRSAPAGFEAWRTSRAAHAVVECESLRDGSFDNRYGKYRGYWQMDADFWSTYGGRAFAPTPERASRSDQDLVAYRGFLARGWEPWTCARILGLYP